VCLAIPGQLVEFVEGSNRQLALVDVAGTRRNINIGLLDEDDQPAPGDWILIHMGFALSRIDEGEAAQALGGLRVLGAGGEFDQAVPIAPLATS
jgi:hydrogenase assembly chaperone HypC/HupF